MVVGGMTYAWLMAPHEYEPDYDAYMLELDLLEASRANVGSYDDWFLDEANDGWVSLNGFVDPPAAPAGFVTQVKYDSYMGFVTDYRIVRAA